MTELGRYSSDDLLVRWCIRLTLMLDLLVLLISISSSLLTMYDDIFLRLRGLSLLPNPPRRRVGLRVDTISIQGVCADSNINWAILSSDWKVTDDGLLFFIKIFTSPL